MGTTSCKECISDLEGQDHIYDQNILEALQGKNGQYQLRYKWVNEQLVKVEDHEQSNLGGPLMSRKGAGAEKSMLDPKFNPEYEIICDGFSEPEKNIEPRNFTLSLSAIKGINNIDQSQYRPSDAEFLMHPDNQTQGSNYQPSVNKYNMYGQYDSGSMSLKGSSYQPQGLQIHRETAALTPKTSYGANQEAHPRSQFYQQPHFLYQQPQRNQQGRA